MQIVILTQYYPPEIGAPQRRLSHLAERLAKRGHHVTVLTAMPNYPTGKIHSGYRGVLCTEQLNGVNVVRTYIYPTQSVDVLKRMANYLSFVVSSFVIGGWLCRRCDYLMTESPPLFLGISGYLLSRWKRARWIFNVSDLWPESAVRLGMVGPGPALRISEWLEAFCYRKAWCITGQSSSILSSIKRRFPNVKTVLFSNGVDIKQFQPSQTKDALSLLCNHPAHCTAVYAGLHGLAQGLDQIIDACAELDARSGPEIFLIGEGPVKQALIQSAKARSLTNIHFMDPMAAAEMPKWIGSADIALVTLKADIPGAVPSKLYEAMAVGVPVLLVAAGEPADIVKRHRVGVVVKPGDTEGLARALKELVADPERRELLGRNGRIAAEEHFDRETIVSRFAEYLEQQI